MMRSHRRWTLRFPGTYRRKALTEREVREDLGGGGELFEQDIKYEVRVFEAEGEEGAVGTGTQPCKRRGGDGAFRRVRAYSAEDGSSINTAAWEGI